MRLRTARGAWFVGLLLFYALCLCTTAAQAQNVALGKPVINGSSSWNGNAFNGGQFPASNAVDGGTSEPNDGPLNYWLGSENTVPEFFTIDLGAARNIDEVRLFNTHNRQFNDRGTDEFVLYAGNTKNGSNQITDEVPILSANLPNVAGQVNITPEIYNLNFGPTQNLTARYLRFEAITHYSSATNGGAGLSEIEVYDLGFVNPNMAAGKPVIEGSGAWDGGTPGVGAPFDGGSFPATKVTDSSTSDSGNYWLGREQVPSEHFTLDLQSSKHIEEILLRNTHNDGSNDRGTREFRVLAGDAVDGSNQIINPVVILEGKLPNVAGYGVIPNTVFTADNGLAPTDARYLRFETLSSHYDGAGVGLNEMEVYDHEEHAFTPMRNNIAARKPVIDGSGSWPAEPFNGANFPANRVTDESTADNHIATGRSSYWLGRDATNNEYFTIDLGDAYNLEEVDLLNTHNQQFNDRATDEFLLLGSLTVDGSNQLVDPLVLASGNLSLVDGQLPIAPDVFSLANGGLLGTGPVRYLQFVALTMYAGKASVGLNEIEVYGSLVPEPGGMVLAALGALGLIAGLRRRRRRARP